MNVEIVSNTPNNMGGENVNNKFTMALPEPVDVENSRRNIRVLRVSYPLTIENVGEKKCGIRLYYNFELFRGSADRTLNGKLNPEKISYRTDWLWLPAGHYTLPKMVETLNMFVNEYDMSFVILSGGGGGGGGGGV